MGYIYMLKVPSGKVAPVQGRSTPPPATASGAGPSVVDLVPSDTDAD